MIASATYRTVHAKSKFTQRRKTQQGLERDLLRLRVKALVAVFLVPIHPLLDVLCDPFLRLGVFA
jgi:hypothetical protein